ncbi:MAG: 50S ribosomal protein L24 [Thermotogae bacterium]|nr:50S ribosomal protein L24 [Thermotogota bacterium]
MAQKIRTGDMVVVISGKYKNNRGRVLKVFPKKGRAMVEDVNLVKRHRGKRHGLDEGRIEEKLAPIYLSKLKLICPKCGQPTRVGFRFLEDGKKVRYCKKCGEVID